MSESHLNTLLNQLLEGQKRLENKVDELDIRMRHLGEELAVTRGADYGTQINFLKAELTTQTERISKLEHYKTSRETGWGILGIIGGATLTGAVTFAWRWLSH